MIVRRVCCWCQTTIGLIVSDTMTKATHGGCERCVAAWKAQYLPRKAA